MGELAIDRKRVSDRVGFGERVSENGLPSVADNGRLEVLNGNPQMLLCVVDCDEIHQSRRGRPDVKRTNRRCEREPIVLPKYRPLSYAP